jgi:hypothetical protein
MVCRQKHMVDQEFLGGRSIVSVESFCRLAGRQAAAISARGNAGKCSDLREGPVEAILPGPMQRPAQRGGAGPVDQAARHGDELGAQSGDHGELVVGVDLANQGGPAAEVMGEHGTGQPRPVGVEVPRWAMR